eukprot:CAMPEP_0194339898 /NCGR_PEP_ID=MMETSP0171-20130528/84732_1 /TAXON_ID=218684 /ORGANISM="Corethron pennatum, Strain L29A3" /LENGTH=252 /DNA_ID=CAMNT_0039104653 /DNA_START=116 /DNA_END=874 /DNA_ORIENTATION=+
MSARKKCVYIARYGLRKCSLVEGVGPFDMDISLEGATHAKLIATRLCEENQNREEEQEARISGIYSSPFYRSVHTSNILASSLGCPVKIEEGLTEWLTTGLVGKDHHRPRSAEDLHKCGFGSIDLSYSSVNPIDSGEVAPHFVEDQNMLIKRSAATIGRILENVEEGGSVVIVSHAPVNQGVALALERSSSCPEKSSFKGKLWYLGGLTKFNRPTEGNSLGWTCVYYGDTAHMPIERGYRDGEQGWTLPCLE